MENKNSVKTIVLILFIIWIVSNFINPYYSIPLWIILFFHKKRSLFEYFSIVVCSEIFPGIDTLSLGVMSNIQFFSIFILIKSLFNTQKKNISNVSTLDYFFLIFFSVFCFVSFALSEYNSGINKAPINWIVNTLIVLLTFKGLQKQLVFFSNLFVFCVLVVVTETFLTRIIFLDAPVLFLKYSVANVNHIGFLALSGIALITYLYAKSPKKIYKYIFFVFSSFIFYAGGRLNLSIFLIFLIFHMIRPFYGFFLNRKIVVFLGVISVFTFSGLIVDIFMRNTESKDLFLQINSVEDLNNSSLNAFGSGRAKLYYNGINMFRLSPVFGNGFLSWTAKKNIHNTWISKRGEKVSMHSTIVQYLAEIGLVGLVLYLSYLFRIVSLGKYISKNSNTEIRYFGRVIFLFSVFLFLGGLFDNHSMTYTPLHFVYGLAISLKNN